MVVTTRVPILLPAVPCSPPLVSLFYKLSYHPRRPFEDRGTPNPLSTRPERLVGTKSHTYLSSLPTPSPVCLPPQSDLSAVHPFPHVLDFSLSPLQPVALEVASLFRPLTFPNPPHTLIPRRSEPGVSFSLTAID